MARVSNRLASRSASTRTSYREVRTLNEAARRAAIDGETRLDLVAGPAETELLVFDLR